MNRRLAFLLLALVVLLLATPVYWYGPTALMKGFMDRLVPFNRPQGRPLIAGKGAQCLHRIFHSTILFDAPGPPIGLDSRHYSQ